MKFTPRDLRRPLAILALAGAAALSSGSLSGCASPAPYTAAHVELPFDQAVDQAGDGLIAQARTLSAFRFGGWFGSHGVVVDPMLDGGSGQQTATTQRLQQRVTNQLQTALKGAELLPFESANVAKADYLLTGTLTRRNEGLPKGALLLNLALTDLKSRRVVAQAWSLVRDSGLDATPLRYYRDSPVLVRDRVIEGYIATTAAAAGQPADPDYLKNLAVAPGISAAEALYDAEQYTRALERFTAARAAGGEQMRVLTGIYLALAKTGRSAEADAAFARLAAYGIANDQLRVKFLFNPGSTTFWADPHVSGSYAMWLREIAKQAAAARACMTIVGHTSHTGTNEVNDALSLQRAEAIRDLLIGEVAPLAVRTGTEGRGFRENLIGSGTDDVVDALDRRVEFRVVPCH